MSSVYYIYFVYVRISLVIHSITIENTLLVIILVAEERQQFILYQALITDRTQTDSIHSVTLSYDRLSTNDAVYNLPSLCICEQAACNILHVTDLADWVLPTIMVECREFLVSYN